jgi:DHA1 family tetracycline resistance protein-like MFS transporter
MSIDSPVPTSAGRKAAFIFVFFTVMLDMLALGMIIPVLPKLVTAFMGGDSARAAEIYGVFGTVWALMQFVASPVLGALSDRFGRRPVILLSNFGMGMDYVLMALAPSLGWLFVGRVISGITAASISTAGAYIADVTPPDKRAGAFGMLGAAFGIGFVVGPAVGGILGQMDPRWPFWFAGGLSLLNALYGLLVLPESLPKERRAAFSWKRANPVGSLALLRSRSDLLGLAAVSLLYSLAHVVLPSTFVLYTQYRFGWDERTVGLTLGAVGICSMVVQGGLVRPVVRKLGERNTLLVGLFFGALSFAVYGLARTGKELVLGIPLAALWGLSNPALQGLMSRKVLASEQGRLQGALSSIMGISNLIGPAIFTMTFAAFIRSHDLHVPGAPFLLASLFLVCALGLGFLLTRGRQIPHVDEARTL